MNKPLVSICITCYNHEKYVGEALEKALNQTYQNTEILISDDGSTDGSREVITRIIETYPGRNVKTFFSEVNTSFQVVRDMYADISGKYLATISADDYWEETVIEKYVAYMEQHGDCAVTFCIPHLIVESGVTVTDNVFEIEKIPGNRYEWFEFLFIKGNSICAPTTFARRDVWEEMGGWKHQYLQLQDYEMWLQILKKYEIHLFEKGEIPIFYRYHGENLSTPTFEVRNRDLVENEYILCEIMESLERDFFVRTFSGYLKYPEDSERFCLDCEKMMILYELERLPPHGSILFYFKHIQGKDFAEHMEKDYAFPRKKLYELTGTDIYYLSFDAKMRAVVDDQFATIEKQNQIIDSLMQKVEFLLKERERG